MQQSKIIRLALRITLGVFVAILLVASFAAVIAYKNKEYVLDQALNALNETLTGRVAVQSVAFSPFENFPYVSIDLQGIEIHETKSLESDTVLYVQDAYLGFDFWSILKGNYTIKKIKLSDGMVRIVEDENGQLNVMSAFSSRESTARGEASEAIKLELSAVVLESIDLVKINRTNDLLVDAFLQTAEASFLSDEEKVTARLETDFVFNMLFGEDTTFLHDKHVRIQTGLAYDLENNILTVEASELQLERAQFQMQGQIDVADDLNLDLQFSGRKPNFDLFLAFAPPEIAPVLDRYDNGGCFLRLLHLR